MGGRGGAGISTSPQVFGPAGSTSPVQAVTQAWRLLRSSRPAGANPADLRGVDGWVDMADLRSRSGLTREAFNRAVDDLVVARRVSVIPEVAGFLLTDRRRAGSLRLGGEDNHYLRFN